MAGRTAAVASPLLPAAAAVSLRFLMLVGLATSAGGGGLRLAHAAPAPYRMAWGALATSATTTAVCAAETTACVADATCLTCLEVFAAAAHGCGDNDIQVCGDVVESVCCSLADEEEHCKDNDELGAWIECVLGDANADNECELDINSDCSGAKDRWSLWGVSIARYSAAVAVAVIVVVDALGKVV
eukprot:g13251.t1